MRKVLADDYICYDIMSVSSYSELNEGGLNNGEFQSDRVFTHFCEDHISILADESSANRIKGNQNLRGTFSDER